MTKAMELEILNKGLEGVENFHLFDYSEYPRRFVLRRRLPLSPVYVSRVEYSNPFEDDDEKISSDASLTQESSKNKNRKKSLCEEHLVKTQRNPWDNFLPPPPWTTTLDQILHILYDVRRLAVPAVCNTIPI